MFVCMCVHVHIYTYIWQESRRQSDEWEALNNDVRRRVDDMEARSMHTVYEAIAKTDAAVGRVHADVRDVEARLAAEVRQAVEEIKDAEQRLARGVDASMQVRHSCAGGGVQVRSLRESTSGLRCVRGGRWRKDIYY